jgi:hypothetical protein
MYKINYDEAKNQWKLTWNGNPIMSGRKEYLEHYLNILVTRGSLMF